MYRIRLEIIRPHRFEFHDETTRLLKELNFSGETSAGFVAEFESYDEAAKVRRFIMACWPKMDEIMLLLKSVEWVSGLLLDAENDEDGVPRESDKGKKKKPGPVKKKPVKKAVKKRGPGRPKGSW